MGKIFILISLLLTACVPTQKEAPQTNTILLMSSPKSQLALQNKTADEVRAIMGDPTFVRKENPNESWVFKAPDCAVFVFFDKDGKSAFTESKGTCGQNAAKQQTTAKKKNLL